MLEPVPPGSLTAKWLLGMQHYGGGKEFMLILYINLSIPLGCHAAMFEIHPSHKFSMLD